MDARVIPMEIETKSNYKRWKEISCGEVDVVIDLAPPDWLQHVCMPTLYWWSLRSKSRSHTVV